MRIYLGTKDLSQYHVRLLMDNGITGVQTEKDELGIYWLNLQDKFVAVVNSIDDDDSPIIYNIMNGPQVIMSIDVRHNEAQITPADPKAKKDSKGNKPDEDDYERRLKERLDSLKQLVYRDKTGSTSITILDHLHYLRELELENPVKHDQVIAGSRIYQRLLHLFPVWTDHHKLKPLYDKIDKGLEDLALVGQLEDRRKEIYSKEPAKTFEKLRLERAEAKLNALKKDVTDILKKYSSTVQFSLFGHPLEINYKFIACGNLGHHHEARVRAVIKAINEPSTTETQVLKILNQQRDLMIKSDFNVNDTSNKVSFNVLDMRWQNQLPTRRCLSPELQRTSGYLKVIDEALVRVSPQPVAQHHPEQNVMS